jgi:hypothetical protein
VKGVDLRGVAVEHKPTVRTQAVLADLTTGQVRAVLIRVMKAGGLSPDRMADAMRCSRRTVFREAKELKNAS